MPPAHPDRCTRDVALRHVSFYVETARPTDDAAAVDTKMKNACSGDRKKIDVAARRQSHTHHRLYVTRLFAKIRLMPRGFVVT